MKNSKYLFLAHPAGYSHFLKQTLLEHSFNKMRKEGSKIEENRQNIASCAEKMSNGQIKADKTMQDFSTIDVIYSARNKEAMPYFEEMQTLTQQIKKDKTLTKEQKEEKLKKDEGLKKVSSKISKIYARYGIQALQATSIVSVKLYDSQSRILSSKSGGISAKGAAAIAVVLGAAGVGGYAYMSGMFGGGQGGGKTEMEFADYSGSTVESFSIQLNANSCYIDGIDTSDPKFVEMINSPEYQAAVVEIMSTKQAEQNSLQESINNQIIAEYNQIESINHATGFEEDGYTTSIDNFPRIVDSNHVPLESWPAFLTRYKNYLETQNCESYYDRANASYRTQLPQSVVDMYASHNVELDYKKDGEIVQYLKNVNVVYHGGLNDPTTEELVFGDNLPEGTTMEFMQDYYPLFKQEKANISHIRNTIANSDDYTTYEDLTYREKALNGYFDNYYNQIGPDYSNQIQTHVNNIDVLQEKYITDSNEIQNSANEQMASLQQSSMGLSQSSSAMASLGDQVYAIDPPQTNNKTDLIQNFVDSAISALNDAQDAIMNTIDEITRIF